MWHLEIVSCPNNSLKHKDSSFILMNDTEKQQILTIKRLNQYYIYFII